MDAIVWLTISIVGYSLAGVLLVAAVFLFFKMNIPAIIGDLTGRTAARQIQEMREQNTNTGNKRHRPAAFNLERGFLTEPVPSRTSRMSKQGRKGKTGKTENYGFHLNGRGQTEGTFRPDPVLSRETKECNELKKSLFVSEETSVLYEEPKALVNHYINGAFTSTETEVLIPGTDVLSQEYGTTVLTSTEELNMGKETNIQAVEFKMLKDIKIVHTNEVI